MSDTLKFESIPVDCRFAYQGKTYLKLALSMAREEETRTGTIFMAECQVKPLPNTSVKVAWGTWIPGTKV
jgi:hypothetical protein